MKDKCDVCDGEFEEKDLFMIESYTENKKLVSMKKTYMPAAFDWACKKCLENVK